MAKIHRVAKKVYEGCSISYESLCDSPCRELHKDGCPAYYRFTYEKPRSDYGQKSGKKKLELKELR
jgi:hypothetical protein